jgi:penicillin-binding protein 1C
VLADAAPPGLAIGLGGLGLSLFDLVRIYGAIARGGESLELRETLDGPSLGGMVQGAGFRKALDPEPRTPSPEPGPRVLDARAAWYLTSILAEVPAPNDAAPQGISYKTGTSYGYRDAWAIGYDGRHVVGVWVGRPDGAPVPGLKGVDAAVPILLDAFTRLGPRVPLPGPPAGVLTAATNALPPTLRHARVRDAGVGAAPAGPEIAFPPDGARLDLGFDQGAGADAILSLKVRNGYPPFTWFADGRPIGQDPFARTAEWRPVGPGYAAISVVDGRGRASRVRVYLQ